MSLFKRKKKAEPVQPEPPKREYPAGFICKVAGTTFDNEDGENRQDVLEKIRRDLVRNADPEDLFSGYTNKEIIEDEIDYVFETSDMPFPVELVEYEYEGAPAVYVVHDGKVLGNLPADRVPYFLESRQNAGYYRAKAEVTGGKTKTLEWDDDRDRYKVKSKTLTLGAEVTVDFNQPKQ